MNGEFVDRPTIPHEDNIIEVVDYLTDNGESSTNRNGDDGTESDWDTSTLSIYPHTPQRIEFAQEAAANGAYPGYTPLRQASRTNDSLPVQPPRRPQNAFLASFQSPPEPRSRPPQFGASGIDNRTRTPHLTTGNKNDENEDVDKDSDDGSDKRASYGPDKYWRATAASPILRRHPQPSAPVESPSMRSVTSMRSGTSAAESRHALSRMTHRSSTSMSLLFGEVINLEDRAAHFTPSNTVRSPSLASYSPYTEIDLENPCSTPQGMEIGGGFRSNPRGWPVLPPNHSKVLAYTSDALAEGANLVRLLTQATSKGLRNLGSATRLVTHRVVHCYQPPLSPRARDLEDFEYLQATHKQKVGMLSENSQLEDHYDFVILLKPQEVYSYWADLLDFRVEHLGDEYHAAMDPVIETASTNSTASQNTDEADSEELEPLRNIKNIQYSTPLTEIRHRPRTPSGSNPTPQGPNSTNRRSSTLPPRPSLANSWFSPAKYPTNLGTKPLTSGNRPKQRLSMFEKAVGIPPSPADLLGTIDDSMDTENTPALSSIRPAMGSTVRRRWGNRAQGSSTKANILSPPVRSLTRGDKIIRKIQRVSQTPQEKQVEENCSGGEKIEEINPNRIDNEEDLPNPVIPRGIAVRTNGMLPFLSALNRGIVVRRHRANNEAVYCKISSNDGGDTMQYQLIDTEEAMVAFKEQRIRYNKKLSHGSSETSPKAMSQDWACVGDPEDESQVHKFNVPDHVAAHRYKQKLSKEKGLKRNVVDLATKAANSGVIRTADIVAVHPASHLDPRPPGVRRGDLGTASLRKSKSEYFTPQTFSIVVNTGQRFGSGSTQNKAESNENKWYSGEGNDLQFKTLDFEAATEGEYWLIFRGFLLLHRDATVGRFAAERRAGIGGASRKSGEPGALYDYHEEENLLHRDEFLEPATVGCLERTIVRLRKLDTTYLEGAISPSAQPPPSDYFLGFKSPGTQIWSRLRLAGLETTRVYSIDKRRVMIKIRCPEDRLTDVAEVLRVKMTTFDGSHVPFREDTTDIFRPLNDRHDVPPIYQGGKAALLRSRDRQNIINFIIGSRIRDSGAELGPNTDVGRMILGRVPLHMHSKLDSLYRPWVFYWKRDNWTGVRKMIEPKDYGKKCVDDLDFPDATSSFRSSGEIPNFFTRFFVGAFHQPLDSIEEYFGEQVTFYFAWLQHCARHLLVLSVVGVLVSICQWATNNVDHPIRPYFALVVMIWTFMVLVNWRKRSNLLAYKWGSMDYKAQETPRPEFHGEYVVDEITQEWVVKYPKWKRWLKYLISVPITAVFTGMAMMLILLVHKNRDLQMANYIDQRLNSTVEPFRFEFSLHNLGEQTNKHEIELTRDVVLDPAFWVAMGALPALLGLCIPLLNLILMKISVFLNDFENYRTESEYNTNLIIKVFSFRFVSQFGTLYYYAAVSTGDVASIHDGIIRMGTSVMIYTTVAHWWSIFLQVYIFMFIRTIRRRVYRRKLQRELKRVELEEVEVSSTDLSDAEARQTRIINKRMLLDQAQDEIWFEVMDPPHDSFPSYISAVVQFSFVACFSIVLPMTPVFCLFNFLLSMRYDAYKLCRGRRRPLAKKTGGIGVWEHLLHIVAVIAVLTNCWLIAFTTADFTWLAEEVGDLGLFAIVVAWEHVMLLIKYVLQVTISPLPRVVRDELKREQHRLDKENYTTMRTKDHGRRGKTEKTEMSPAAGRSESPDHLSSPFTADPIRRLETISSYDEPEITEDAMP